MRWFKHLTKLRNDEKVVSLREKHGMEGYGFYLMLIEIVAENTEGDSESIVTYSLQHWGKILGIYKPKTKKLFQSCSDLGLIDVEFSEEKVKVSIPKINKYRDEYSERRAKGKPKNRDNNPTATRQTPEQETDTDTDVDVETEAGKIATKSATTTTKTTTIDFVDAPQKPPVSISASTSISPISAADRNRLAAALGKMQVSDAELLVWQELKTIGVTLTDVEAARMRKGQNRLTAFLGEIACEERDRRQAQAADDYEQPRYFQTGGIQ